MFFPQDMMEFVFLNKLVSTCVGLPPTVQEVWKKYFKARKIERSMRTSTIIENFKK